MPCCKALELVGSESKCSRSESLVDDLLGTLASAAFSGHECAGDLCEHIYFLAVHKFKNKLCTGFAVLFGILVDGGNGRIEYFALADEIRKHGEVLTRSIYRQTGKYSVSVSERVLRALSPALEMINEEFAILAVSKYYSQETGLAEDFEGGDAVFG